MREERQRRRRSRAQLLSARSDNGLASVPEGRRRFLALKVAGYSYREICSLTGATYTNINRHLTRARARLREAKVA